MQVQLINYTQSALELLLYTKNTRLMGAQSFQDIINMPLQEKLTELAYMRDTIQSSWEFVDYTFHISEVTRAFTHQLVRTRTGSYAQQAQRVVDLTNFDYVTPIDLDEEQKLLYQESMENSFKKYGELITANVANQDARGVIPTNVHTEIIAKFNLRTLHDMGKVRLCTRTQGEYQNVFREIKRLVIETHPWAKDFIKVACALDGICVFPRYAECPIQKYTYNGKYSNFSTVKAHAAVVKNIEDIWESERHEANPVVSAGKTSDGEECDH